MTTITKGAGHAIFFDGDETPTIRQNRDDPWRPERADLSWRVEDEDTGRVIEEYHPNPPRRAIQVVAFTTPIHRSELP